MGGSTKPRRTRNFGGLADSPSISTPDEHVGGSLGAGIGGSTAGCDIHLDTDLAGVRVEVIEGLVLGEELDVALRPLEGYEAVACVEHGAGRIAGTLANVEKLDRLIGCIRSGHRYRAVVLELGSLRCRVLVDPVRT